VAARSGTSGPLKPNGSERWRFATNEFGRLLPSRDTANIFASGEVGGHATKASGSITLTCLQQLLGKNLNVF
jgi:hypothetical protein